LLETNRTLHITEVHSGLEGIGYFNWKTPNERFSASIEFVELDVSLLAKNLIADPFYTDKATINLLVSCSAAIGGTCGHPQVSMGRYLASKTRVAQLAPTRGLSRADLSDRSKTPDHVLFLPKSRLSIRIPGPSVHSVLRGEWAVDPDRLDLKQIARLADVIGETKVLEAELLRATNGRIRLPE